MIIAIPLGPGLIGLTEFCKVSILRDPRTARRNNAIFLGEDIFGESLHQELKISCRPHKLPLGLRGCIKAFLTLVKSRLPLKVNVS